MKTLGERLKTIRGSTSQTVFSKQFGIPQTTLSNYEKGRNKPDFDLIDNICTEFGVGIEWLLFGRGDMKAGQNTQGVENSMALCGNCAELMTRLNVANDRLYQSTERERTLLKENSELKTELITLKNKPLSADEDTKLSNVS